MMSFHRFIMLKRSFKIFVLVTCFWMWLCNMVFSHSKLYESTLTNLKRREIFDSISGFQVWKATPDNETIADIKMTDEDLEKIIQNYDYQPGINGKPVKLNIKLEYGIRQKVRVGWEKYRFNEFVSDVIPVNRSLVDSRDEWCQNQNYSSGLPHATVVICFFEEAWSTLIRTITSVINRSPPHLLDQIILIDDFSSSDHLLKPLEDYIALMPKVTLRRASRRLGVVGARLLPLQEITSPVIVYLDSHCECTQGWLEPLLQRLKEDPNMLVSPVVDQIHSNTLEYTKQDTDKLQLVAFTWDLNYSWIQIPHNIFTVRKIPAAPIKSPVLSGGILAINKEFFEKIGYFDTGMESWGGENIELSIRIWMCGGSLEIIPCSHVGHIYMKQEEEVIKRNKKNLVRVAEVWLDDYAKYFFERIGNDKSEYSDVFERKQLRQKLNCKPFKWYLENVYPQLEVPDSLAAKGQIYSTGYRGLCLDAAITLHEYDPLNLKPCHYQGGKQYWTYTSNGEIRRDKICMDYLFQTVTLFVCNNAASQVWLYFEEDQIIRHLVTKKCLDLVDHIFRYKIVLTDCSLSKSQRWIMENFKLEELKTEIKLGIAAFESLQEKYKTNNSVPATTPTTKPAATDAYGR